MSVLNDLAQEIEDYPREHLELDIIDVEWRGDEIDSSSNERVTFRIEARNTGHLDMLQLHIKVEGGGVTRTLVKSNYEDADWEPEFTISGAYFGDVLAHQGEGAVVVCPDPNREDEGKFMFRPREASEDNRQELVRVSLAGWTAGIDTLLTAHSQKDEMTYDIYESTVGDPN